MSKYTTEVRYICEECIGLNYSEGYFSVDNIISLAREKIFDFEYPIFDQNYKSVLETKILKHFYMREIGAETVGLWKLWLNRKMNEIMPYYNQLYKSELFEFNPMYDVDVIREHKGTKVGSKNDVGESNDTSNDNGAYMTAESGNNSVNNLDAYADTPQGSVANLEDYSYLTNARKNVGVESNNSLSNSTVQKTRVNTATNKLNSTINDTEQYLEHVKGKQGGQSYAKMLIEYRKTFMNIDMNVIEELNDLFMNLW